MNKEAFERITDEEMAAAEKIGKSTATKTPIIPVPDDAPPFSFKHPKHGWPSRIWAYHTADGGLAGFAARFDFIGDDGKAAKEILPICFCQVTDGAKTYRAWRAAGVPTPRPLYRLPQLLADPLLPILIVEGEKTADKAAELFPDYAVTTTMGGSQAPRLSDLEPLAGRRVVIWPDNDEPGRNYAADLAALALDAGAASVEIVEVPAAFPEKWDLADDLPAGVELEELRKLIDAARPVSAEEAAETVKEYPLPYGFRVTRDGLFWRDQSDDDKPEILVAGEFEVLAETRDAEGNSWGLLLRWHDHDGRQHEVAVPRAWLAGDGSEVRKVFLDGGNYVAPSKKARDLLSTFLGSVQSKSRAQATNRLGWHDRAYAHPCGSFGDSPRDRLILQGVPAHAFAVKGKLEGWNAEIGRYARGNSRLLLASSTAFAALLVHLCGAESGGFHFRGASSTGKSTTLRVAGSVWGGPNYVRSWRATANGLEGVASLHCDALLCLDEISQLAAREAGEVAYMLANGAGKSRSSREGAARKPATWRLLFLSSGEISLADKAAEDTRHRRPTAGQQVRVVDIPADAGAGLGLFEDIHGFASAEAFASHLKKATAEHFGIAARAFLQAVVENFDDVRAAVADHMAAFVAAHVPEGADGQVQRVAQRFALVAAAGEIATHFKVVDWEEGDATKAAARCFSDWIAERGGVEPAEQRDGLAQVRAFISAHGQSRFAAVWESRKEDDREPLPVRELAGYRKRNDEGHWEYFVTTEAWKQEVCRGYDAKALAAYLGEIGLLLLPEKGLHRAKSMNVPGVGKPRLYHLSAKLLQEDAP